MPRHLHYSIAVLGELLALTFSSTNEATELAQYQSLSGNAKPGNQVCLAPELVHLPPGPVAAPMITVPIPRAAYRVLGTLPPLIHVYDARH